MSEPEPAATPFVLRRRRLLPKLWKLYRGYRDRLGFGRRQPLAWAWRSVRL